MDKSKALDRVTDTIEEVPQLDQKERMVAALFEIRQIIQNLVKLTNSRGGEEESKSPEPLFTLIDEPLPRDSQETTLNLEVYLNINQSLARDNSPCLLPSKNPIRKGIFVAGGSGKIKDRVSQLLKLNPDESLIEPLH